MLLSVDYTNVTKYLFSGDFRHINIHLSGNSVRETVIKVLSACNISTKYVDKIPRSPPKPKAEFR